MNTPLLVADGTNLTHRCWHASGRSADPAITARLLLALVSGAARRVGAGGIVVCFDGPHAGAHRHEMYPGYKAGRPDKDDALRSVLAGLPGILREAGYTVHTSTGIEADDTLAHYAADTSADTVLLTSDKDAFSLLAFPRVAMLRVTNGGSDGWPLITGDTLIDHVGVGIEQYGLYAALKGDSSDNIVGVAGIGPTFALKLAQAHGTVEAFLADLRAGGDVTRGAIGAGRCAKLTADVDAVATSIHLAVALTAAYPVADAPARAACTLPGSLTPPAQASPAAARPAVDDGGYGPRDEDEPVDEYAPVRTPSRVVVSAPLRSPVSAPAKPSRFSDYI